VEARWILRCDFADVVGRYHGRPATDEEIDSAISEDPSDDLASPGALLLVARAPGEVLGCAGLRLLPGGVGEITRLFVVSAAREAALGARLMHQIEAHARSLGVREMRRDTRRDLVEAQRLNARIGYEQTRPFNDGPHADLWFRNQLV
jgi:GNAT superfamily N-acetyltransferase